MPEREVSQVLATYIDEDGATCYALSGQTVRVHADDVARFDKANGVVTVQAPTKKTAAPKKAAPTRKA